MAERTLDDSRPHNSDLGGSMFRQASDIHIHGGTFNAYGSNEKDERDEKKRIADSMALLDSRMEQGAPYDAAAREDVPKCHEHTRVAIMEGVHKWAASQEPDACPLMWMYGPAGSGKTTIMQSVAETFDKEGSLAASFFFSRLSAGRPREKGNFITTLSRQLSLCIPTLQPLLADALMDPSIVTKSLTKQLDALVIGPLNKLDVAQIGPRHIFLVDGLDECNGDTAQQDILNLLEQFVRDAHHPIRILVASRSLSHLRAFFSQARIAAIAATTPLDNDYQSDADVKRFLDLEFAKIRAEHPSRDGLPPQWPSCPDVEILVARASGQFIYASVVMKFIAGHGRHPVESLQTIINSKAGDGARSYEELDAVYAQVLSTIEAENVEFVQTLMGCLLLGDDAYYLARVVQTEATGIIDVVFMLHAGTTEARINRMHPLITTKHGGRIQFSHASFPDYLLDSARSKGFFLDMRRVHCSLACYWFESFSAHFKSYPDGGVIPRSAVGYKPLNFPTGYVRVSDGKDGEIFLEPVYHCLQAEWTPRLRHNILSVDVCTALKFDHNAYFWEGDKLSGWALVSLLNLTFWAEQNHRLSSADTEHFRGRLQSELLGLSLSLTDRRMFATMLTWFRHFRVSRAWIDMEQSHGVFQFAILKAFFNSRFLLHDDIQLASCMWLCQTLVPGMAMNGSFFSDESLYSEIALRYARSRAADGWRTYFNQSLTIMLSKAGPSEELASFLVQNVLSLCNDKFDPKSMQSHDKDEFFMAICIYLYECGIPFHSEHQHRPGFNSHDWLCGVCLHFDPFSAECQDVELSRDPAVKPVRIAEGEVLQPLQMNPALRVIPGVLLLWLQAWIIWLANAMMQLFPVVA
ncbi:hypothetical protein D9619_009467 [Psilocybe cf. subviscida]|uniref:NACHT domain-containing protein n=1 Tax=Psilocybe cf. subviscida TaxID=2480587 RepID=A0A8H5BU86_9AGAR|nr:hypothetical protein D9619_009467 [Psilocybe cf. subviscida]